MIHIIGGGPSGLSLAYYAHLRGVDGITIYEMKGHLGGMARSWNHHDFVLDTGPHIFHTADAEIAEDWQKINSDGFDFGKFSSCNFLGEYPSKIFDYPVSLESLRKNLDEESYKEIHNQLKEIDQGDNLSASASTFREFMNASVGEKLTELFFSKYPQKVWGMPTDEMLAEWAPQRIQIRKITEPFYTKPFVAVARRGTGDFYNQILRILESSDRFKVYYNSELSGIEASNGLINKLLFKNKLDIQINEDDHIVSTIPAQILARILGEDIKLRFRGVRTEYLFFKNPRILPEKYNWAYCSDPNYTFNRVTEPSSMASEVSPSGHSFVCVETTYPGGSEFIPPKKSFEEPLEWLRSLPFFNTDGYIPQLNTQNFENHVYPIQNKGFRTSLASYNSLISSYSNLSVIGTGGEFHYSDMQIIFRKSKNLIESLFCSEAKEVRGKIPLISDLNIHKNIYKVTNHSQISITNNENRNESSLHLKSKALIPMIAEIGINHNGNVELAKSMMLAAKNANCHFTKFQLYQSGSRLQKNSLTEYLHETAEDNEISLNDIFERSRLDNNACKALIDYGNEINIPVFFTVFDIESAQTIRDLGQEIVKVASMDCNNLNLHKFLNKLNFKTVIISSGMTDEFELLRSISIYSPDTEVLVMSCRSSYPAKIGDIDLGEINYLKNITGRTIGFSDHTEGILTSSLAVASGAKFLERHFTTDKDLSGPDNPMSLEISEISELSNQVQLIAKSLSNCRKIIHPSEQSTFSMQKKSLRFPRDMTEGERIHTDDLIALAPPEGYDEFQASLSRGSLVLQDFVKAGDPVSSETVRLEKE